MNYPEKWTDVKYPSNPYLPSKEHVPDAEPHLFGDRVYIYGSHDSADGDRYCPEAYVSWSADPSDLASWKYEGIMYAKGEDPLDPDGTRDYYAPDAVRGADGRYYLYYSINESYVISVAAAEMPQGPFHFYGHVRDEKGHVIGASEGDDYQFDPAVLADDDGRFYLFSGQGMPVREMGGRIVKGAQVCELAPDMLTVIGKQHPVTSAEFNCFTENPFFEASSIRKIDGTYYFVYSPLPNTHYLCYATSDRPDGGYVYRGVLVSNADIIDGDPDRQMPQNYFGNNHGGLLTLKDRTYIFYHRNSCHSAFARQGCLELLERKEDGLFAQAELTSTGTGEELPLAGHYAAYTACCLKRKDMPAFIPYTFFPYTEDDPYFAEEDETPAEYIANMRDGSVAGFRYYLASGEEKKAFLTLRRTNREKIQGVFGETFVIITLNGIQTAVFSVSEKLSDQWEKVSFPVHTQPGKTAVTISVGGKDAVDLLEFGFEE